MISRLAGEGHNDMPVDMTAVPYDNNSDEYADFEAGDHFLRLSQTEKNMVEMVCENFDKVIVVYNGSNPMELGWVEDYDQIGAVIWAAGPGNTGFNALAASSLPARSTPPAARPTPLSTTSPRHPTGTTPSRPTTPTWRTWASRA